MVLQHVAVFASVGETGNILGWTSDKCGVSLLNSKSAINILFGNR